MKKLILFLAVLILQSATASTPVSDVQKLEATARIWGFLKYYHPQVAEGKFNWDQKLIDILPEVEKAQTKEELSALYITWIDGLGEVPVCKKCSKASKHELFEKNFSMAWMEDSATFTPELTKRLKYIEANRHLGNKHYVRSGLMLGGAIEIVNEPEYENFDYPDAHHRLLSLFRYWNVIEYFFPYKYQTDKKWDDVLADMIPKVRDAPDAQAYHLAMLETVASIDDSHAYYVTHHTNPYFGYYWAPFRFRIVEEKAIVTGFYDEEKAKKDDVRKGDIISHVNGIAIMNILAEKSPYIPASNQAVKKRNAFYSIFNGSTDKVSITLERDGVTTVRDITRYYRRDMTAPVQEVPEKYKILDGNIGYVNMGIMEMGDIGAMMDKLEGCRAIIFDIRNYPKGTMYKLGRWLLPESRNFVWFTESNLDYPGKFKWNKNFSIGRRNKDHYKGKILLLVDESTQSHAEFTAMGFQKANNVITIGSQTSAADGNVFTFKLPGGYETMLTGLGVFYPGGGETQRVGINVDVEVLPTLAGIRAGKDEVLERAMEEAQK